MSTIPRWSPRGTYTDRGVQHDYERATVEPCHEEVASCTACGRANFERDGDAVAPSGLKLVELGISPNGLQRSVTHLCPQCALLVGGKLTAAAHALGATDREVLDALPESQHERLSFGRYLRFGYGPHDRVIVLKKGKGEEPK